MTSLIEQLPDHYQRSPQDAELQRVLGLLASQLQEDKELTLEQLYPSNASGWGLELWERAYGLTVDFSLDEERRRSRVLAKVKGVGVTTTAQLRGIAEAFSQSAVEIVELFDEYRFEIWYTETTGPIAHPEDLAAIVNELKPAHLEWAVKYRQTCPAPVYGACVGRSAERFVLRQEPYQMPKWPVEAFVGAAPRLGETFILQQS